MNADEPDSGTGTTSMTVSASFAALIRAETLPDHFRIETWLRQQGCWESLGLDGRLTIARRLRFLRWGFLTGRITDGER